jgi:hypothetical protein
MPLSTMVAQSALDLLAAEAAVKVHEARLWRAAALAKSGAGVGIGMAATRTEAVLRASPKAWSTWTILKKEAAKKLKEDSQEK